MLFQVQTDPSYDLSSNKQEGHYQIVAPENLPNSRPLCQHAYLKPNEICIHEKVPDVQGWSGQNW